MTAPEPVDWAAFIRGKLPAPRKSAGQLEPGCEHDFLRFPMVEFNLRYLCGRCCGTYMELFDEGTWGLSLRQIDERVEERFGGRVTHTIIIPGELKALDREGAGSP